MEATPRRPVEPGEDDAPTGLDASSELMSGAALSFLTMPEQWALRRRIQHEIGLMEGPPWRHIVAPAASALKAPPLIPGPMWGEHQQLYRRHVQVRQQNTGHRLRHRSAPPKPRTAGNPALSESPHVGRRRAPIHTSRGDSAEPLPLTSPMVPSFVLERRLAVLMANEDTRHSRTDASWEMHKVNSPQSPRYLMPPRPPTSPAEYRGEREVDSSPVTPAAMRTAPQLRMATHTSDLGTATPPTRPSPRSLRLQFQMQSAPRSGMAPPRRRPDAELLR